MFTLVIEATFKPDKKSEFLNYWNSKILPAEKQQDGFVDEFLLFSNVNSSQALGLSFWETKQHAENYYRNVFPTLTVPVQPFCEKQPLVREFDVAASETFDVSVDKAA